MTQTRGQILSHLAAMLAVSNLGLRQHVRDPLGNPEHWCDTPEGEIDSLAGHLMESDEHEELFHEEARSWYDQIKDHSNEELRKRFSYSSWAIEFLDGCALT